MDLYFYEIAPVKEKLPEVIDLDETPIEYECVSEERASDWEKEIGQRCLLKKMVVNMFDTAKKIFGKNITSIRYTYEDGYDCMDDEGNWVGTLTKAMLSPYYYQEKTWSYVYVKETIVSCDCVYVLDEPTSGIKTYDELMQWVEEAVDYVDNGYSGECYKSEGQAIFVLMKAALCARRGKTVLCEVD